MKAQFSYKAYLSGHGKHYALFLKLKAVKTKGIYYNFSYERLSQTIGISKSSLRKYLPILLEKGWVRMEHGHLHIISYEAFRETRSPFVFSKWVVHTDIGGQK